MTAQDKRELATLRNKLRILEESHFPRFLDSDRETLKSAATALETLTRERDELREALKETTDALDGLDGLGNHERLVANNRDTLSKVGEA